MIVFIFIIRISQPLRLAEYIAAMKKLSTNCAFEAYLNKTLRDRLICGLRHEPTQKRLLSEVDLTFTQAIEIGQSFKAAEKNVQGLKTQDTVQPIKVI